MDKINRKGFATDKSKELADLLNNLLVNYSIFYQKTRVYHWNISGHKNFKLYLKFEELYNDLCVKIDYVAERILTLGRTAKYKFTDYLGITKVPESIKVTDGNKAIGQILNAFNILLTKQR